MPFIRLSKGANIGPVDRGYAESVLAAFRDICLAEERKCLRCGKRFRFKRDETLEIGQQYCPKCAKPQENHNA